MMIKKKIKLFSIAFYALILGAECLTMEGIMVPAYVFRGDTAELRCKFKLDQDSLYSVTWYKDHEEFYRYVPKNNPKQHTYKLEGAKIEQQRSGVNYVRLKLANSAASGVYRCEVSAEAPSFVSKNAEGRMDVVSLPKEDPEISGEIYPRDYRDGDILSLNCTSGRSHPPVKIRWFVNENKAPAWFEIQGGLDGATVSGLRLRLSRGHFPRGLLTVRCEATVGTPETLYKKEAYLFVRGSANGRESEWKILIMLCSIGVFAVKF